MMSDFVESARHFVNSAVSRTGWEAQKQLRLRNKQGEIDKLLEQRQQLLDELLQAAMTLYQRGALTDAQMSRLCASVLELDHDVRAREQQIQEIKAEAYVVDQSASSAMPNYAPPPVNPTQPAPANSLGTTPPSSQAQERCPQCGSTVRSNSLYCRGCGAKLR
jgi:hypothetical protein